MAISTKEIKLKKKEFSDAPFLEHELKYIKKLEDYIDNLIVEKLKSTSEFYIDLTIFECNYDPINKRQTDFEPARKLRMQKELESRYKKAGWKIEVKYDDGLDGPNLSGSDYVILKTPR